MYLRQDTHLRPDPSAGISYQAAGDRSGRSSVGAWRRLNRMGEHEAARINRAAAVTVDQIAAFERLFSDFMERLLELQGPPKSKP